MPYVQYPYATLVSLGKNLTTLSEQLQSDNNGAKECAGLDEDDHSAISEAVEFFHEEWETSLGQLTENIGNWGEVSQAIGKMVSEFDEQLAVALRPTGEG